jgi:site-specific DNA-methyltransferase (adenine-specific)
MAEEKMSGRYFIGDALEILKTLEAESAHCCVTSPPYWGLRDYGVDGQIGLESAPAPYIERLVEVFREVRRVLRDDGTLWLNIGDSYVRSGGEQSGGNRDLLHMEGKQQRMTSVPDGMKPKNLVGIPWRVAFALQADGWYLRSDIIWHKPNPMPESVTDRPTKAHEYIFLLSKNQKYFYDADAIKEPVTGNAHSRGSGVNPKAGKNEQSGDRRKEGFNERWKVKQNPSFSAAVKDLVSERNKRTVWTVPTDPFSGAHFACFPPKLIKPCILAGCPAGGTVIDPFFGSGTTGQVAEQLGRKWIGIELNPEYAKLIEKRTAQLGLDLG